MKQKKTGGIKKIFSLFLSLALLFTAFSVSAQYVDDNMAGFPSALVQSVDKITTTTARLGVVNNTTDAYMIDVHVVDPVTKQSVFNATTNGQANIATGKSVYFIAKNLIQGKQYSAQFVAYDSQSRSKGEIVLFSTLGGTVPPGGSPMPPISPLPIGVSATSTKTSLTFKAVNNGTDRFIVMGDLYIHGTTTNPVRSGIDFGGINKAQVVSKTVTGLTSGTRYDLKLTGISPSGVTQYYTYEDVATNGTTTQQGGGGTNPNQQGGGGTNPTQQGGGGTPPKDNTVTNGLGLDNPTGITSIEDFVAKALNIVVDIGTPIVALFLIIAGFMFVAAQGNEEKLATAKRALLYTIIGAALILGCWGIAQAIKGTVEDVTKTAVVEVVKHDA